MASNHNSYWERREEEALKHYLTEEVEYQKRIDEIYADMLDGCQSEIDRFYRKYADDEGIPLTEAQKRISRLDIEAYERKAQRYVADAEADRRINGGKTNGRGYYFSTTANAEMKLYNATMKINRLEMLKANIGLELIKGTAELETFMGDILQGRTEDELKRQAGILGDTIRDNAKAAHSIVNASFHNATFSERLWGYHTTMKADLSKLLQQGLIQGKGNRELARELQQYFVGDERLKNGKKGAKYAAETLMRTELARVQTSAQKLSFERMGFDEYTFHANSGCCGDCQALNGKHFKVEKMMPGENASPLHPRCRCSVSAYSDRKEYDEWLDFLSKGGTTEQWKMRNDKAYQDRIKARREAYKKRMETSKPKTVADFSKAGTDLLLGLYDERRLHFGLNQLSAKELRDLSINPVKADYKGVSEKTAAVFNETISRLGNRFYSGLQSVTVGDPKEYFGANFFATTQHIPSIAAKDIVLNPAKMHDFDKWTERVFELGQKGWGIPIPKSEAGRYIVTHEFAHTILDMNSPMKNYVDYDTKITRSARREIKALYEDYKSEVTMLQIDFRRAEMDFMLNPNDATQKNAAELGERLRAVKLGEYAMKDADEFMAESFAYREIIGDDNKYANKVMDVLEKYYSKEIDDDY